MARTFPLTSAMSMTSGHWRAGHLTIETPHSRVIGCPCVTRHIGHATRISRVSIKEFTRFYGHEDSLKFEADSRQERSEWKNGYSTGVSMPGLALLWGRRSQGS